MCFLFVTYVLNVLADWRVVPLTLDSFLNPLHASD